MRVKTSTVYQMEIAECGAASLGMILLYYGAWIPLEKLREDTGVTRDGCNAWNILQGAEKYGLKGKGLKLSAESIRKKSFPCIIHWNFNHFVVLEGFLKEEACINDPAKGRYRIPFPDFEHAFTGIALFFEKTEAFEKTGPQESIFSILKKRFSGQGQAVSALLLSGLLTILPGALLPILTGVFIDRVLNRGQYSLGPILAFIMLFAFIFRQLLLLCADHVKERLCRKLSALSSRNLTEHIFRLPVSFFEQRYLGDIVLRGAGSDDMNDFLLNRLPGVFPELLSSLFYLIILLILNVPLTLIGLFGIAASFLISVYGRNTGTSSAEKHAVEAGALSGMVYSGLSISETLKASGAENEYASRIIGKEAGIAEAMQESRRIQGTINALEKSAEEITAGMVLFVGAAFVIRGQMSPGKLAAFLLLFFLMSAPVGKLLGLFQTLQFTGAKLRRQEDVEHYPEAHTFRKTSSNLQSFRGKLTGQADITGVTFGYSTFAPPVVRELSFHLEPGKTVALVGGSGSGKTTAARLLSGLVEALEGEIRFDGILREQIPEHVLNASIATVSQKVVLFGGTVRDNITMYNRNILEEDMIRAAKDACIHDVIMGRKGAYDHVLTENGGNFSGGQRQRIEIARALAVNPSILILDEATSALDSGTEKQIIDNIRRRGCTCIIAAHRLSAIRDCDEILVLKEGRIEERGTHQKLLSRGGYYSELIRHMQPAGGI